MSDVSINIEDNINPFVEIFVYGDNKEALIKKYGFKIEYLSADILNHNKLIVITVRWTANEEYILDTKYGVILSTGHELSAESVDIHFPKIKYEAIYQKDGNKPEYRCEGKFGITVGLQTKDETELKYDYIFFQNLKYGVQVWFAPDGWDDFSNSKEFFLYESKEEIK